MGGGILLPIPGGAARADAKLNMAPLRVVNRWHELGKDHPSGPAVTDLSCHLQIATPPGGWAPKSLLW